ncbi:MAG TPA: hypothetical protein VI542_06090 [Candidatus Tectomicrobia bacterium]
MSAQHCFYDDNALLDLRYLIAAEPYDIEDGAEEKYSIGCLMEVGSTPQRMYFEYQSTRLRDEAFTRLIAQHQAWMRQAHTCEEEDEEYDPS